MNITFYRNNKISDKEIEGICKDITFKQLVINLKYPKIADINQADFFALKHKLEDKTLSPEEHARLSQKYLSYKDSGFFIGGKVDVASKSRKADKILSRSLLTFDIDIPKIDIWKKFIEVYPNTQMVYYSTISSNKDNPRYRVLIPLKSEVSSKVYTSIMKKVIYNIDTGSFDSTTSEASRVMFLPCTCKDIEFDFRVQEGDPLDPKDFDTKEEETANPEVKEFIDPKTKNGVIGAFNRAYSISETINEFLSDKYSRGFNSTAESPRYKYVGSTGSPGARVYNEDSMIYSTHDTDPAKLKNLDSFGLVKIHLFEDDFDKTIKWAKGLPSVQKELHENTSLNGTPEEWTNSLLRDKGGNVKTTAFNLRLIFENDKDLHKLFRLNELTVMLEVNGDLEKIGGAAGRKDKGLEDADITDVQVYLEMSRYRIVPARQTLINAIIQAARLCKYDPVNSYLLSLEGKWDGVPRIATMFTDYLMVEDSPLIRTIARKVMAAAVWRVKVPGIKWEGVPVFHGNQGCGKSTFVQKLYKSSMYESDPKHWINDTPISFSDTDKAIQNTKGFWGIELAELANTTMSNYSNEVMKAFISNDRPVIRLPYERFTITLPRRNIFWGTTNQWHYISDQTGGRRFLPLDSRARTMEDNSRNLTAIYDMPVDQMWAEVLTYYKTEKLFFTTEEEKELAIIRKRHTEESNYEAILNKYLSLKLPLDWEKKTPIMRRDYFLMEGSKDGVLERDSVSLSEFTYEALGKNFTELDRKKIREIEMCLLNLGWEVNTYPIKTIYGQTKTYRRRK